MSIEIICKIKHLFLKKVIFVAKKLAKKEFKFFFFFALFCFSENPGLCRGNLAAIGQAKVTKVKVCVADAFCGL